MKTLTIIEGRAENGKVVRDLIEASEKRGWKPYHMKGIDKVKMAKMELDDEPLDYIVFRDLSENSHYEMARLKKWVDFHRKIAINMDAAGGRASTSDKYFQHGLFLIDPILKDHVLPMFEVEKAKDVEELIKRGELKYPVVMKPRLGTAGKGMVLAKSRKDLYSAYDGPQNGIIVEQYIEADRDWRVFVMGGASAGIMKKTGDPEHPEDFEAWSAGRTKQKEEDPKMRDILMRLACRAAGVSKLEYTGVDIIQDKNTGQFYVLETNFAAGWQNRFIETTGENIAERVVEWIEDRERAQRVSKEKAIKTYIEKRLDRVPRRAVREYRAILDGDKKTIKKYQHVLDKYSQYKLEEIPLSWAGNFIGPDVFTLEEGMITSAMWLRALGKL